MSTVAPVIDWRPVHAVTRLSLCDIWSQLPVYKRDGSIVWHPMNLALTTPSRPQHEQNVLLRNRNDLVCTGEELNY